ncbi:predicted protein [Uncinocarpus reesii 1704]|uniref:Uncharacterized protein n=1 Tax=Uncinocarpus reesii (strain UAMH 1704) TaxID=336963 RepID=C4JJW7_UNCRE|nr:uncharacterized protein UREG_01924 [Uncinocarpus reesii 1704]EEP77075.1 predicted protein [Uncinocarpus reesii 1704]
MQQRARVQKTDRRPNKFIPENAQQCYDRRGPWSMFLGTEPIEYAIQMPTQTTLGHIRIRASKARSPSTHSQKTSHESTHGFGFAGEAASPTAPDSATSTFEPTPLICRDSFLCGWFMEVHHTLPTLATRAQTHALSTTSVESSSSASSLSFQFLI